MAVDNYPLTTVRAQHFQGPDSDSDNGFRTVPTLLRAVADWMDENDIQDPEFDDLRLALIWERPDRASLLDEDDPYHYSATVYYDARDELDSGVADEFGANSKPRSFKTPEEFAEATSKPIDEVMAKWD